MRHTILVVLLTSGLVGGLAVGLCSLHHRVHEGHPRRAAFERHIADLCVQAAARAQQEERR